MSELQTFGPFVFGAEDGLIHWQDHYRLDDQQVSQGLGLHVDPLSADLLDVAVAAYVADRRSPRRPKRQRKDGTFWRRQISVEAPVRERDQWLHSGAAEALTELLEWLTDDMWSITLVDRRSPRRKSETNVRLFADPVAKPTDVALFSGGLDSLLGASEDLDRSGELILVAAGTGSRLIGKQRQLAKALLDLGRRPVRIVSIPVGLTRAGKDLLEAGEESSQRTRGLVFLSLGLVVARAAGVGELRMHENGPGALNLPLTGGQHGSMNTRAARPETLLLMQDLASRLFGQDMSIVNPQFWRTKAEMCKAAPADLHPLMAESVTCDGGLTRRVAEGQLCGVCTSCLLRRQALLASGLGQLDHEDLARMAGDGLGARREHAAPSVLAMVGQAARLQMALAETDPWAALVDHFPELSSARRAFGATPDQFVDLLQRYVDDWRAVPYSLVSEMLANGASHA